MTPSEYTRFRDDLGQSSGFQSWQYRAIEYLVGNKNAAMLRPHEHVPEVHAALTGPPARSEPVRRGPGPAARRGFASPTPCCTATRPAPTSPDESVLAAWQAVYRDPHGHWELYELAEKLVDLEDYFRRWRFNHVTTVERIIGAKRGTGGTSGTPTCGGCSTWCCSPSSGTCARPSCSAPFGTVRVLWSRPRSAPTAVEVRRGPTGRRRGASVGGADRHPHEPPAVDQRRAQVRPARGVDRVGDRLRRAVAVDVGEADQGERGGGDQLEAVVGGDRSPASHRASPTCSRIIARSPSAP
jgi:hypothetical protein